MGACVSTNNLLAGEMQRTRVFFGVCDLACCLLLLNRSFLGGNIKGRNKMEEGSRAKFPGAGSQLQISPLCAKIGYRLALYNRRVSSKAF